MLQNILDTLLQTKRANLIYQDQVMTAQQLVARTQSLIALLQARSQQPILFFLPNSPELLCWYMACFYLGIPIVPIIYEQDSHFIQQVITLINPQWFVTTTEKQTLFSKQNITVACEWHVTDETHALISLAALEADQAPYVSSDVSDDALAMIVFSSGSTGELKGIQHSYQSTYGFLQTLVDVLSVRQGLTYLIAQPMGHIGGILTLLLPLLHEGTGILLSGFAIDTYLQAMQRYQPTHINLHTPLFYQIIQSPDIDKQAFKRIESCFAGGDTIPMNLPTEFTTATGRNMRIGYGMTETGIVIVNKNPYGKYAGSVGEKISIAAIELRDHLGQVVPEGQVGEMWVKSPGCCSGYWHADQLNQMSFSHGWFRTYDLAYMDHQGFYWYRGRATACIHRGDHIVYPGLIEQVLFECPDIIAVAVIAVTDPIEREVPVAFVEVKNHPSDKVSEIEQYAKEKLQFYEIPKKIIVLDKLPLNLTGKIDRNRLRELWLSS